MSVVWWRSLHQQATILRPGAPTIAGSMLVTLMVGFVAFNLAYGYLMAVRMRVGRIEDRAANTVMSTPSPRARKPRLAPPEPLRSAPSGAVRVGPAGSIEPESFAEPASSGSVGSVMRGVDHA